MSCVLGIDTSNYTTSVALYNTTDKTYMQARKLLNVDTGNKGLRQSQAVFLHTKQLHTLVNQVMSECNNSIDAVCVSVSPRSVEKSYMPCFLVGLNVASSVSAVLRVPLFTTSHQNGHIMAALYSANKLDLINKQFLAYHISGGTSELLKIMPHSSTVFSCEIIGKTLDLHFGQLIDRVGVMLGLDFPCGNQLDTLSLNAKEKIKPKNAVKNECDFAISGIENQCIKFYQQYNDKPMIADYVINSACVTLENALKNAKEKYDIENTVCAGGVMCNSTIRADFINKFDNIYFAKKELSCDNAVGVACIGAYYLGELNG